jgi:hypothetical protein
MVFKINAQKEARAGRYNSLLCRAVIVQNGEAITQTMGTGELRVDEPLPPKVEAPKPAAPPPQPAAVAQKPPEVKRLSRLEQLRLEREQQRVDGQ